MNGVSVYAMNVVNGEEKFWEHFKPEDNDRLKKWAKRQNKVVGVYVFDRYTDQIVISYFLNQDIKDSLKDY